MTLEELKEKQDLIIARQESLKAAIEMLNRNEKSAEKDCRILIVTFGLFIVLLVITLIYLIAYY